MKHTQKQTYNHLKVSGDKASLDAFIQTVIQGDGTIQILDSIIPIPGPSKNQIEQWGAIFGDYGQSIIFQSDTEIVFEFWSYYEPLIKGLASVSMLFPTLVFTGSYYTTTKSTMGSYKIEHGQVSFVELNPENSQAMKEFSGDWTEETEKTWFDFADAYFRNEVTEAISV